jgi:hypothetical protein
VKIKKELYKNERMSQRKYEKERSVYVEFFKPVSVVGDVTKMGQGSVGYFLESPIKEESKYKKEGLYISLS